MQRLKQKQKEFFLIAHLAAKERVVRQLLLERKPLDQIRPVIDEVAYVMRAFRYSEDELGELYG